jgi:hypothetical protein
MPADKHAGMTIFIAVTGVLLAGVLGMLKGIMDAVIPECFYRGSSQFSHAENVCD